MTTPIYNDEDADLSILQTKRLAFIGYGNQGAAQAQNLRDSGVSQILIGNRDDAYKDAAIVDGFQVVSITDAAAWGDLVFLLIPDEVQPQVFREQIAPSLKTGASLVVASGYNVAFQLFDLPNSIDVIMVAFRTGYKVLHEAGFSDEAILYEMYLSKEPAEVFDRIADQGLFGQLTLHSHTSQYGQLRASLADDGSWLYEKFKRVLEDD